MNTGCPVCGSENTIKLIESENTYKCMSCDAVFTPREPKSYKTVKRVAAEKPVNTLTPKDIYKSNIDCVFEIMSSFGDTTSSGTGFYISKSGYIITNSHVIINLSGEKPQLCDFAYAASSRAIDYKTLEILYCDPSCDLALLKNNEGSNFKSVELASEEAEVGDEICTIGNIKGEGLAQYSGRVTDVDRNFKGKRVFMHDALVAGGCSGGPVFNDKGKVCGVVIGGMPTVAGMNYAIPLDSIKKFIKEAEVHKGISIFS